MVVKKINLVKKQGENICSFHPTSSADVIKYGNSLTVENVLDAIVDSVEQIENRLASSTIYMTNSKGEIIRDEAGVGLVELL